MGGEAVTAEPSHPAWLQQARSRLRDADPALTRLIAERPDFDPQAWTAQLLPPLDLYAATRSVASQPKGTQQ